MRQNLAVLHSETSEEFLFGEADRTGQMYVIPDQDRGLRWPRGHYAYLAANGAVNLMRRLGMKCDLIREADASADALAMYGTIVVAEACALKEATVESLTRWHLDHGGALVVSGPTGLPAQVLGIRNPRTEAARAPLALWPFQGVSGLQDFRGLIVAPEGYPVVVCEPVPGTQVIAEVEFCPAIRGVRAPSRGPGEARGAVFLTGGVLFLSFSFFEWVGGLLQAQVCPDYLWGEKPGVEEVFYLETLCRFWKCLLDLAAPRPARSLRHELWPGHSGVVVLRHDTDDSRDTTYLELEKDKGLAATYAILPDRNEGFWFKAVSRCRGLEAALHFRTNRQGLLKKLLRPGQFVPDRSAVADGGLVKQYRSAARRLPFPYETVHRHSHFLLYPETVIALGDLAAEFPEVLGSSSFFRFHLLSYSGEKGCVRIVPHPHPGVSFFFPYRIVDKTVFPGRTLPFWELSQLMEPDPDLLREIPSHLRLLPDGVYMLGYHPAHARRATFSPGGNVSWLLEAVRTAEESGLAVMTFRDVCLRMNDWEKIKVRAELDGWSVLNDSDQISSDVVFSRGGERWSLGKLGPFERRKVRA